MIKKYNEYLNFINEAARTEYKYGCVMVFLDMPYWKEYTDIIEKEDVSDHEDSDEIITKDKVHITILYGLHKEVDKKDIDKVIETIDIDKFNIKLKDVSYFEGDKYDVVKISVTDKYLTELNKEFKNFPHTSSFPDYKPHITLAYVKKGKGEKYCDGTIDKLINEQEDKYNEDKENNKPVFSISKIVYSDGSNRYSYDISKKD